MTRPSSATGTAPWKIVFWLVFLCSWCGNQFTPLLLLYKEQDHYSAFAVNTFLGVYVFGLAPALLVSGAMSDRHGRRPVMLVGTVTSILASGFLAFSTFGAAGIYAGRLLAGVTVGIAMAVGNSWLKELSQSPYDTGARAGAGALRASLAFTLGSAGGALVAGSVAQLTPWGETVPFVVHVLVMLPFLWLVRRVPETSTTGGEPGPFWNQLRVPAAGHRRFRRTVAVAAPWILGSAAIAYGYVPVLLEDATGDWGLAYATLLTVVALVAAALVQPLARRIDTPSSARGLVVCLATSVVGLVVAALAVHLGSPLVGVASSLVLGAAIGVGLVSSLLEVQRIASPRDLAGLTGVFYAVTYTGFLLPAVLSALSGVASAAVLILVLAVLAGASTVAVLAAYRQHLPTGEDARPASGLRSDAASLR